MAYFSKEAYERKREWAANNNASQRERFIEAGGDEDTADAIVDLCEWRHDFHSTDAKRLANEDAQGNWWEHWKKLEEIRERLKSLKEDGIVIDLPDIYDDNYPIELLWGLNGEVYTVEDYKERYKHDGKDFKDFWEDYVWEFSEKQGKANKEIERFLLEIDKKYGTEFCPSGMARTQNK